MSRKGVICRKRDRKCELCGKVAETRPYGPKGEEVCFECGMKDEAALGHADRDRRKAVRDALLVDYLPGPTGDLRIESMERGMPERYGR